jgi:predicted DNA-binding protein (MmcQ/YjbR family)
MNIEDFRIYCLKKHDVTEDFPFDESTLVFRIGGKIFALCDINDFDGVNLKCDPEKAVELREQYDGVTPGYHMSKKHWNTVLTDGSVPAQVFQELIDHSYDIVKASLPKKLREQLG